MAWARGPSPNRRRDLYRSEKFIDGYYREFPKNKKWQEKIKTEAKARGYVENLNGHGGIFDGCPASQGYGGNRTGMVNMPLKA